MSDSIFPRPGATALIVIDIQERLLPAMRTEDQQLVVRQTGTLVELATAFGWPIVHSEQYPKGLGHTVQPLREALERAGSRRLEKVEFSCARNAVFNQTILPQLPSHIVVAGMETHICVLQTVADLQARGHQVFVAQDAVASRTEANRANGLELMRQCGAVITNTETLVFQALQVAGTDQFKHFSKLIR